MAESTKQTHKKSSKKPSSAAEKAAGGSVAKKICCGVEVAAPSADQLKKFGLFAGGGFLVLYGMVSGLIGYAQTNVDLFATFFEVRVLAMSFINTLGFAIFGLTTLFGMLLGFWYLRYIEGEL